MQVTLALNIKKHQIKFRSVLVMNEQLLLGFTKSNEVVFANISNERGYFSVSFDTSYPMAIGYEVAMERVEDLIEQMDSQWTLDKLNYYDCKPSELAYNLYKDTYNVVEEFFDNSLYTESFDIEGVEETIYFLASGCGQHDTRGQMAWNVNTELYNYLHELWDEFHLEEIPQEKLEPLVEAVKHQHGTLNEEAVIENWLKKIFK
jgi:hypothetical protein